VAHENGASLRLRDGVTPSHRDHKQKHIAADRTHVGADLKVGPYGDTVSPSEGYVFQL